MRRKAYLVSMNGIGNAGGVERVAYYLNKVLIQQGWQVVILDKKVIDEFFLSRIIIRIFGRIYGSLYPLLASVYLQRYCRSTDLVVGNGYLTPLFAADYVFCHGTLAGFFQHTCKIGEVSRGMRLICYFEKLSMRKAKKIISVSKRASEEIQQYYGVSVNKVRILNNCVDGNRFYPIEKLEHRGRISIIFCGRLEYNKGVEKLRQLSNKIEGTNIHLHIACNYATNLDLFHNLKNTHIRVGLQINELNEFYNMGNVMYFPSAYEGFEMVTLEALSAGIPVLGNPVGAVDELNKKNFVGVELIDETNILEQIRIISKKYQSFKVRKELHERVNEILGIDVYKKRLLQIFGEGTL